MNLDVAKEIEKLLREAGARVYLTRTDKDHVHLCDRADIANKVKPDFFISICQSTFPNQSASGTEAYYYREDNEAAKLGNIILDGLCQQLQCRNRGLRIADFYMLKEVKCSTLQINLLYMTNPEDESKLAYSDRRRKAAEAIAQGIISYYEQKGK